ncbi:MAG TPA: phosphatidylserine decarboxylase family protein [Deltaproteobacteria bacterium]|nr:MAG: phosphatidylserine decarboxylase [Deltaproteobacteria bacterium GWD2_42_10]OGP48915.1 MAG: phosphatidylserine decarboxylase [Deltaproteobacteria bacterium GWF2_42_12]OGQ27382.1 MAG: phosphatidylserine decarboxylase [Deltaproteobacteria bacterium RIFCSPHIGHO2_02_FULL_42_44]OGQ69456.1 MAG: phosphatidylserine decarboxylase [Deltaproteobacteria bacterium RIFCSPLOWO2_12_FULL_42_16]OGQ74485.1 MAG: phosphatidylserine decarboxylase [Deltaproteobacteria bacterium RIFOXYA2_FULL_42_10]HAG49871.1 
MNENRPVAVEGLPFIVPLLILTAALWYFGAHYAAIFFLLLTAFVVWFFRNPERDIPSDENSIVSPADGKVIVIGRVFDDRFLKTDALKISIFMNVFNVHVNRIPTSGKVLGVFYNPGKFFSADKDKASLENEQNALLIEAKNGKKFVVNQIAGLIARRIVCYAKPGDSIEKGRRFGMIRFGSRLDVYLPTDCKIDVNVGDKVKAGSSILAHW